MRVRNNPKPRARARDKVAALARRGAKVHWVNELNRIIRYPTLDGVGDIYTSKERIYTAKVWAYIQNNNDGESDIIRKSAYPGKLKKQNELISWSQSLRNYLSTIMVQNRVP